MIIYIVTQGEYSDYGIKAVFTDKEKAMYYCAMHNDDYYEPCVIEEWDSDAEKIEGNKELVEKWNGYFSFEGNFENLKKSNSYEFQSNAHPHVKKIRGWSRLRYEVTAYVPVGTSEDKVKKIVCDRFAKYKAEQMGVL